MASVRMNMKLYVFLIAVSVLLLLLFSFNQFDEWPYSHDEAGTLSDSLGIAEGTTQEVIKVMMHSESGREIESKSVDAITSIDDGFRSTTISSPVNISEASDVKFNVLFIVSDDLRPQLGSYRGKNYPNPHSKLKMHTPNLDLLAGKSLQLNRAYVQFSVCSPSRASYMTGRRPDTTHVWDLTTFWRDAGGNFTTIPQYFKERGYRAAGFGKIYHPGQAGGNNDIPLSWSEPYYLEKNGLFYQVINDSWWAVPEELSLSKPLHDEGITTAAVELLGKLAPKARSGEEPFFVAVGFQKPHIPFVFPERYLKHYPLKHMDLAHNKYAPKNFPPIAWFHVEGSNYDDIKRTNIKGIFNETLPDDAALLYRRAYFACVTFIDDMVGRLLRSLDELDLSRNTIVTFIGDHGFHLGENGMWGKHTNMEQATHAPMMIHVPGRTDEGAQSDSIVEFLDLFPTIVEAAGLNPVGLCPEYSSDVLACSEGRSFSALLDNPQQSFKEYALSQIVRTRSMGYTLRDDRYRYVEWVPLQKQPLTEHTCSRRLTWDTLLGRELYDHNVDPEEDNNVVDDDIYALVVEQMSKDLRQMIASSITTRC